MSDLQIKVLTISVPLLINWFWLKKMLSATHQVTSKLSQKGGSMEPFEPPLDPPLK